MTQEEKQDLENQIDELCLQLYAKADKAFTPLFPFVFIRVLTKEQQTKSGIYLPSLEQNKPVHEGVVLATWIPKTFETSKVNAEGHRLTRTKVLHSEFAQGDHVLFPHWAGAPIPGYDPKYYRVVKEWEWDFSKDGGIIGIVNHEIPDDTPRGTVESILAESLPPTVAGALSHKIFDKMLLVDRDKPSLTLSGR